MGAGTVAGSGSFPAASRSNTDGPSRSSYSSPSAERRGAGAGGSGLLTSDGERGVVALFGAVSCRDDEEESDDDDDRPVADVTGSSFNWTFMSLPCRELGAGGGAFFRGVAFDVAGVGVSNDRSSSSGPDISCDVRGVSVLPCADTPSPPAGASKMDTDEASVELASPTPLCRACRGVDCFAGATAGAAALPVRRRRRNASTSSCCVRPGPRWPSGSSLDDAPCSRSWSVL